MPDTDQFLMPKELTSINGSLKRDITPYGTWGRIFLTLLIEKLVVQYTIFSIFAIKFQNISGQPKCLLHF